MASPLALTRLNIQRPEAGIVRVVSGASVTIYDTMADGTAAVFADGTVQVGAVKSTLYADRGGVSTKANPLIADSLGVVEFYKSSGDVHVQVVATDGIKFGIPWYNVSIGGIDIGETFVNVRNFLTFQDAINALPALGGTVFVPAGIYTRLTVPKVTPMIINKRIHLKGEGNAREGQLTGSVVQYRNFSSEDTASDLITITGDSNYNCDKTRIEDIYFVGANAAGAGRGLVINRVASLIAKRCTFYQFPSWAVDGVGTSDIVLSIFDNCEFLRNYTNGLVHLGWGGANVFATHLNNCHFIPGAGRCLSLGTSAGTEVDSCTFEADVDEASANGDAAAFIYMESQLAGAGGGLHHNRIHNCWMERITVTNPPDSWLIYLKGIHAQTTIDSCFFARPNGAVTSLRAIKTEDAFGLGAFGLSIKNNIGDMDGATSTGTDDIVLSSQANVVLENNSIRDGLLYNNPMRVTAATWGNVTRLADNSRIKLRAMTTATRDALTEPQAGDLIFNTTTGVVNFYNGAIWGAI